MSTASSQEPSALAPLRQRNFVLYEISSLAGGTASTMLQASVVWQVWEISGSAFWLGIVGLVRFVPTLLMSLVGGAIADSYDRRRVVLLTQIIPLTTALVLFATTHAGWVNLHVIFGMTFFLAMSTVLQGPARAALLPSVVPREILPRAVTMSSTASSLARISGPAVAGFLIGWVGVTGAYGTGVGLTITAMLAMLMLRARPVPDDRRRSVSIAAIKEGLSFVWQRQVLVGVMALDLLSVVFGGATALLPVFASDILSVGPRGFGILSASIEIGAMLMSGAMLMLPPVERAGRALFLAVAAFGLATIVFGLSAFFPLSLIAYMIVGMGDQASVVMRVTTIQMATPPELLGRVNSVNFLFAVSANELGTAESGMAAAAFGAPFAVVSGGIACMAALTAVWLRIPALRDYRIALREAGPAG